MTKQDLAGAVADEFEMTKKDATRAVEFVFEQISGALKRKDRVKIPGFGIFSVRDRAARMGRNPQTGEAIKIAASRKVAFRPSQDLKMLVGAGRKGGKKR
ncbi:MAG: HU family DNA-binding protein [Armatimonadetes bacterium]|nr:HU family DNA-binding protein [Armatimonadota bacterium]